MRILFIAVVGISLVSLAMALPRPDEHNVQDIMDYHGIGKICRCYIAIFVDNYKLSYNLIIIAIYIINTGKGNPSEIMKLARFIQVSLYNQITNVLEYTYLAVTLVSSLLLQTYYNADCVLHLLIVDKECKIGGKLLMLIVMILDL